MGHFLLTVTKLLAVDHVRVDLIYTRRSFFRGRLIALLLAKDGAIFLPRQTCVLCPTYQFSRIFLAFRSQRCCTFISVLCLWVHTLFARHCTWKCHFKAPKNGSVWVLALKLLLKCSLKVLDLKDKKRY